MRKCRTLLDTCSTANFITEKFASRLNLPMKQCSLSVGAINSMSTFSKNSIEITFKAHHSNFQHTLTFFTIPKITDFTPSELFPRNRLKIPKNIKLADPEFHLPQPIDMLIGSGPTISLFSIGRIDLSSRDYNLYLQKTLLGWVVAGSTAIKSPSKHQSCHLVELEEQIAKFWTLEEVNTGKPSSNEESACETHFVQNVRRNQTGRYTVRLPFRDNVQNLGDSRSVAYKRFHALERKLNSDPELKTEYSKVIDEYLNLGHMSLVQNPGDGGYYLPHHAVIKTSSATTKVRVVFDASAKTDSGISLNDTLLVGPTIQPKLFNQLLKFRLHKYVLTADIEKMYRQVEVPESDRIYQRLLWRVGDHIKTFQLNTLTFGVSSSPFLAIRTIHKLADDEIDNFPKAAAILKTDLYVDDLLTGAETIQAARELRDETINLLNRGGFNIRQWASNDERLLKDLSDKNINSHFLLDKNCTLKTLGISWDAQRDNIQYTVNSIELPTKITKRNILSEIAKIFDPLGLLGPIILHAKRIMQILWQTKVHWDESVPSDVYTLWYDFVNELNLLRNISFERKLLRENCETMQIHGFSDASMVGYGACLYLRSRSINGETSCQLLCAKSRVAPLKPATIPRLELCGAQLLVRLFNEARPSLNIPISKVVFWCDSTIVLQWLKTSPNLLKTYVANRVVDIQEHSKEASWRHVRSEDNPADALSRGQLPSAFANNRSWAKGPTWLSDSEEHWPEFIEGNAPIPELKKNVCLVINRGEIGRVQTNPDLTFIKKFSSYSRLLRVTACILRLLPKEKRPLHIKREGSISVEEIAYAEIKILKYVQSIYFNSEIRELKKKGSILKTRLANLSPFIDDLGLLRVGGRLKNSNLPYIQKHPIFLPSCNYFTDLIIRETHVKQHHSGIQATLYTLRQKFWILDGKNQVRKIIRSCVRCFRFNAETVQYKMGDLPHDRVTNARAFQNVGTDYCGPFYIKEKKHRNRAKIKTYVCVFICMTTKAVHLEVVSDMTTEGFLGALRRFISRRGMPMNIYSDNGTNFVGANNHLKELYVLLNSEDHKTQIGRFAVDRRIKWHFIPPLSPHQGGLWESTVKLFKHHLKRVVGDSLFTYEEFNTFTIEIEGILNSRPLTPLSSDPNDLSVLTPSLYLIGEHMTVLPEPNLINTPSNRLSVWRHITKVRQDFWARWHLEYLNELQQRHKWMKDGTNLKENTVVLIKDKNIPCTQWPLGRIVEVHPGNDGVVRTVSIKTANGILKRPSTLLCPLPIDKD